MIPLGIAAAGVSNGPLFRSVSTATGAGTVAPSVPTGTADGDVLVAYGTIVGTSANTQTLTAPAGWTLRAGPIDSGTDRRAYTWTKDASGESGSYSFTKVGASGARVTVLAVSGGDYDAIATGTNASGTSHTIPTVTTTAANCLVVTLLGCGSGGTSHTAPSGYTERSDDATSIHVATSTKTYSAAGATGAVTATTAGASGSLVAHVSLKP